MTKNVRGAQASRAEAPLTGAGPGVNHLATTDVDADMRHAGLVGALEEHQVTGLQFFPVWYATLIDPES